MHYEEANLVTTADRLVALYAPMLGRWLEANPRFHGISTCISRDDPAAWPSGRDNMGFSHKAFEKMAGRALDELVEVTYAIRDACGLVEGEADSLGVWARLDNGFLTVGASVRTPLGDGAVRRLASRPPGTELWHYDPAEFLMYASIEDEDVARRFMASGDDGIDAVVRLAAAEGVLLNSKFEEEPDVDRWMDSFPAEGPARTSHIGSWAFSAIGTSTQDPKKILVDQETFDRVSGNPALNDYVVQIIGEPEVEPTPAFSR